jgi:hypothetical protein
VAAVPKVPQHKLKKKKVRKDQSRDSAVGIATGYGLHD